MRFIICGTDQQKSKQGIHLRNPDMWYLNDAIQTAERDGFDSIFLHYPSNGQRFKIPQDVLQDLFTMAANNCGDIQVEVLNPVSSDVHIDNVSTYQRALGGAK